MILLRRIQDGELFEPSFPDAYDDDSGIADLFGCRGGSLWYFRHVVPSHKRWFEFWKPKFYRTGGIWEPRQAQEFEIL